MYYSKRALIFAFILASLAGVILHNLYTTVPNTLTALIAPVSESLWEHIKIVFWPALVAGLILSWGRPNGLYPWLLSLVISCILMLGISYFVHVIMEFHCIAFDIGLYFVMMALFFYLPTLFSGPFNGNRWLVPLILAVLILVFIMRFTLAPPAGPLFAAPEAIHTWFSIDV